jgi:hypothetical protein
MFEKGGKKNAQTRKIVHLLKPLKLPVLIYLKVFYVKNDVA